MDLMLMMFTVPCLTLGYNSTVTAVTFGGPVSYRWQ